MNRFDDDQPRRDDDEVRRFDDFGDEPPLREKRGMSTTVKVLLSLFVGGGLLMVLCCGGMFWFGWKTLNMTHSPEEVRAITDSILQIDIPENYTPLLGMNMSLVGVSLKMAVYHDAAANSSLTLMETADPSREDDEDLQEEFQRQMRMQGRSREIRVEESETKTVLIDGVEREFEFQTGTDAGSNQPVRQVTGTFPGRNGAVLLTLTEPEEHWDEQRTMQMLESISTK